MNTLKIFFSEFWPPFIGVAVGVSTVWLLHRFGSDVRVRLLTPKAFVELASYSKEEQRRLLHEASTEAFRHWRAFVPVVVLAFFLATGSAVAHTLPKVTRSPDSWWVTLPVVMVFAVFGWWLAGALMTRYVRPFLQACLDRNPC
ncbi:MAG TPA: hypothetical protein VK850_18660 [Candidatus Binatia bacterium]|nr:hypothetical protein [Candidatus Binatia bacterium]